MADEDSRGSDPQRRDSSAALSRATFFIHGSCTIRELVSPPLASGYVLRQIQRLTRRLLMARSTFGHCQMCPPPPDADGLRNLLDADAQVARSVTVVLESSQAGRG